MSTPKKAKKENLLHTFYFKKLLYIVIFHVSSHSLNNSFIYIYIYIYIYIVRERERNDD